MNEKLNDLEVLQEPEKLEKDESFGIIPITKQPAGWHVFIIKQKAGHVGFPKGHRDYPEEADKEVAERELKEETGFLVKSYYPIEPFTVNYECVSHGKQVNKFVTYFVAEVQGKMRLCPHEIAEGRWVTLEEAHQQISFENIKQIVEKLQKELEARLKG